MQKPVQEASDEYVEACRRKFVMDGGNHVVCLSEDSQMTNTSLPDPVPTNNIQVINKLNTKVGEPPSLIFYHGALFKATDNDRGNESTSNHSFSSC